ncbi:hypothetical protein GGX14DRAFT_560077 [Mycena pura]|uniref:Uncharacterized protein n=1 Tax=Mycena pura TaxID=153505 RepID=A0AAD6YKI0_9AGAR|nr:hypothetical protein GGX14DRAFT_560077 [Mycena pura]
MADPLSNLRTAYSVLESRVNLALRTQLGDTERLCLQRDEALRLLQAATQASCIHQHVFPPAEFALLQGNISSMVDRLDDTCYLSNDPPDVSPIPVISQSSNGKRGRPRKNIDPNFLTEAMRIRRPSGIAPVLQCHPRTVRRHALDLGLVEPGQPVFIHHTLADGSHVRARNAAPQRTRSTLTNNELDAAIGQILEIFPTFGRNLIAGRLKASGHEVTRERIIASYLRVHGAPGAFGGRSIHRKAYKVAGANSLWHHDG